MKEVLIREIEQSMAVILDNSQMEKLHNVLSNCLYNVTIVDTVGIKTAQINQDEELLNMFISAKRVEGCSERTIKYYKSTLQTALNKIEKTVKRITTDDLRNYLGDYNKNNNCSKITIDNIRRILSSFFSWLEDEDHIMKSPVKRIHKVKTGKKVKETYTDENLEILRDSCNTKRDLAIIDLLSSTGMRVGELVRLNVEDIDFQERECIVYGKGNKHRKVYFDARTKIHLMEYLKTRTDDNEALFVSLLNPFPRLQISGVEIRLRELGNKLHIKKVHPHKFRRTLATRAIDKGMPIEQVQHLGASENRHNFRICNGRTGKCEVFP